MKFLCKLALLILAAKVLAEPPKAGNGMVNHVAQLTLHDVACEINDAWKEAQTWISEMLSSAQGTPAKAGARPNAGAHRPVS